MHWCWDKNCHCTFLLITGIINIIRGYICLSLGLYVGIDSLLSRFSQVCCEGKYIPGGL